MPRRSKLPRAVAAGIVMAVLLDTAIQILWNWAVRGIPVDASALATARGALSNPWFYAAMATFVSQLFNWTRVLARADLSFAQPLTALSYLSVLAVSSRSLHESLSAFKLIGVGFVLLGVFFISRTPHRTGSGPGVPR